MKQLFFYILILFITSTGVANAATLSVTPGSANITEGSTFSVTVKTDTQGKSVNVAEATVGFSTDTLEIISVSPGSTFTLQTPGSPNKTATSAYFSAGIPSGYTGAAGVLGRITFRAKKTGKGTISVTSGKVLLNDGAATNALTGTSGASITITPQVIVEPSTPIDTSQPVVSTELEVEPVVIPEPTIVVTPTEVPQVQTTTIRTKDLFTLIYVLIGIIFILLGVIIGLVVVLSHRKSPTKKTRSKKEKKEEEEVRLSNI